MTNIVLHSTRHVGIDSNASDINLMFLWLLHINAGKSRCYYYWIYSITVYIGIYSCKLMLASIDFNLCLNILE